MSRHDEDIAADHDDWAGFDDDDDYESPEEHEAAQRRAEEPPDSYFEQQAWEEAERHRQDVHFGEECNCPPHEWEPLPCRLLLRLPRWTPRKRWHCGTPGSCEIAYYRKPLNVWRHHRQSHEAPF